MNDDNNDNQISNNDDVNTCSGINTSMEQRKPHQHYDKLSSSSQQGDDADDYEFWDDAQALLQLDEVDQQTPAGYIDNSKPKDKLEASSNNVNQTKPLKSDDPSSSSAYSSIRSTTNTTTNNNNTPTSLLGSQTIDKDQILDDLILHKAVFSNDAKLIDDILLNDLAKRKNLVNKRDKHGNTALHLACMLGRPTEIVNSFLKIDPKWSVDAKNLNRWTPFHEACSTGNRDVIKLLALQLSAEVDDAINNMKLCEDLEKTRNYRLVLKWEFQSWVPLISRVLPSETCVINKQGKFIRIDTRLLDFEGFSRKKGDSCLVYTNKKWVVMNNRTKKYEYFGNPNTFKSIDERVDEFMSNDIMDIEFKSSGMQLTRLTSGWFWKADKVSQVGRYNAALYDFTNVILVTRKRREHLSEDDLKRNKSAYKSAVHVFEFGDNKQTPPSPATKDVSSSQRKTEVVGEDDANDCNNGGSLKSEEEDEDEPEQHRESLQPPPVNNVTWEQYITAEPPGNHPFLGREPKLKELRRPLKASVAMSDEFPITKQEFLELLAIVPLKLFKKLKEFVELKLPDGFPVRLDIPIFPFLSARITFEDFSFHEGPVDESLFRIPGDYERDSSLLPDKLKGRSNNSSSEDSSTDNL